VGIIETVLRAADQALQIDPYYGEAYYRRGTARMWLALCGGQAGDDQLKPAAADLGEAERRLPQLAAVPLFLALVHALRGRVGPALASVERAAALEVTRSGLRATEAVVYDATLAWRRLQATVLPGDALPSNQGLPQLVLGRVLAAQGRLDEAAELALRLLPIEEADIAATRADRRRTMRTLPLYGPSVLYGAVLLMKGRAAEACDVLTEHRAKMAGCEHVTAPVNRLLGLWLLRKAAARAGRAALEQEAATAQALLSQRLLSDEPERFARRSLRLFGYFWAPGCLEVAPAEPEAPPWRHLLTALWAARNGDLAGARQAAEAMHRAAPDAEMRADAVRLRENLE
jgi:tetratricopeptide (TPR) repeat protein